MSLTQHIGFGRFRLEDLLPGESFARFDGTLARVCRQQRHRTLNPTPRHLHLPDHILVWIHDGTSNATRVYLHCSALAYALTPEQARTIQARVRRRKEHRT
jgi:hypothetical protein